MNLATVDKIAKAVLYEGYMLYPYRPSSVKNRQRWNFGVLCPRSYSDAQNGSEAWTMQTECLAESNPLTTLEVRVRFLQLVERTVQAVSRVGEISSHEKLDFCPVERLSVKGRVYEPWQEAVEREVLVPACNLETLGSMTQAFAFPAEKESEILRDSSGQTAGRLWRERNAICGEVEVSAVRLQDATFKVTVRLRNTTPFTTADETHRDEALLRSLVSAHTVLGVSEGSFYSLLAPPERLTELASSCKNIGTWPVLVDPVLAGKEGQSDTVLSSPIILYDYPQVAPESAGDLFDGTEIDEILSLRIMTLTDEEKREMSQSDERARQMLERTESMPAEQFMKLHGVLRGLCPVDSHPVDQHAPHEEVP
jgi:hypothetical protein